MAVGTIVMQVADITEGPMWKERPPRQIIPPRAMRKIEPEYTASIIEAQGISDGLRVPVKANKG